MAIAFVGLAGVHAARRRPRRARARGGHVRRADRVPPVQLRAGLHLHGRQREPVPGLRAGGVRAPRDGSHPSPVLALIIPAVVMGIPVLDTGVSILRRKLTGQAAVLPRPRPHPPPAPGPDVDAPGRRHALPVRGVPGVRRGGDDPDALAEASLTFLGGSCGRLRVPVLRPLPADPVVDRSVRGAPPQAPAAGRPPGRPPGRARGRPRCGPSRAPSGSSRSRVRSGRRGGGQLGQRPDRRVRASACHERDAVPEPPAAFGGAELAEVSPPQRQDQARGVAGLVSAWGGEASR